MGLPVRVVFLLDKYPVGVYDANEIGMSVLGKVDRKAIYRLKGGTPMREEVYDISGMHCAACSASVEKVTRRLPGVERSDVNLVAERMTIVYDETQVTPEQIIAKVEKAGFGAKLHQEKQEAAPVQTGEDPEEAELRRKKRELIVSAIFSCALLYALRPARPAAAGSVFHAHPPYEFRRFTAHAGDPGAVLRTEFLYQRLSGTVPRESQHGFAGGHRLCLFLRVQRGDDVFDHR